MATVQSTVPALQRVIATNELVTGPPAVEMLRLSLKHTSGPLQIMDNACGGAILTAELLKLAEEQQGKIRIERIVAADIDENMVKYTEHRKAKSGWQNVEIIKANQQSVPLPDNTFTHVFNNYGVFFSLDDKATLAETLRITKPGGTAGFTSWKGIAWWSSITLPALSKYLPNAPSLPEPHTVFPSKGWHDRASAFEKMERAGFKDVHVSEFSFTPDVEPEAFAEACTVLIKALTTRFWSKEDNEKYGDDIGPAFLKYLQESFPDGRWDGRMTALISIGTKDS